MRWELAGVAIGGTGAACPSRVPGLVRAGDRLRAAEIGGPARADVVDLGADAVAEALARSGRTIADVDALVFATSTPSRPTASDAHRTLERLGGRCAAWDVRSGGAAGVLAWLQAAQAVRDGARAAIAVAGEVISPWLDPTDPSMAGLYADAAAAVVVVPGDDRVTAWAGHAPYEGTPFTVPVPLPPPPDVHMRAQRPDAAYLACLQRAWGAAVEVLRPGPPIDVLLPYAISARQVAALQAQVGASTAVSVLDTHGVIGAASPLLARHACSTPGVAAAIAVGGGISWATLRWEPGAGGGR